jgi:hypothetical protein
MRNDRAIKSRRSETISKAVGEPCGKGKGKIWCINFHGAANETDARVAQTSI